MEKAAAAAAAAGTDLRSRRRLGLLARSLFTLYECAVTLRHHVRFALRKGNTHGLVVEREALGDMVCKDVRGESADGETYL